MAELLQTLLSWVFVSPASASHSFSGPCLCAPRHWLHPWAFVSVSPLPSLPSVSVGLPEGPSQTRPTSSFKHPQPLRLAELQAIQLSW